MSNSICLMAVTWYGCCIICAMSYWGFSMLVADGFVPFQILDICSDHIGLWLFSNFSALQPVPREQNDKKYHIAGENESEISITPKTNSKSRKITIIKYTWELSSQQILPASVYQNSPNLSVFKARTIAHVTLSLNQRGIIRNLWKITNQ